MEEWKDIPRYEEVYQVSNLGNVRNKTTGNVLKSYDNGRGYLFVRLSINGKKDNYYVHRLVAELFLPCDGGKNAVNHIDGNKKNNCATNLEWCTYSENQHHAYSHGLYKHPTKEILQCDLHGNIIKQWASIKEASETLRINKNNISSCCVGRRSKAGNYIWKFKEAE